jgi:hypothetical protein
LRLAHQLGCLLLAVGLQALLIGLAVHHLERKEKEASAKAPPADEAASAPPPAIATQAPRPH